MALNNLGLGLVISAKDLSQAVFAGVQRNIGSTSEMADESGKAFDAASGAIKGTAIAFGVAGAAILGVLAIAAAKSNEFNDAMNLVGTRATEANGPIDRLGDSVMALSNQYGRAATDEAKALYDAIGQGARDSASANAVMTASNQLALATHSDLQASMGTTVQVAKAFGVALTDSTQVADQLFLASKNGAGTVQELGASLEHLAPAAARAHLSSADLLASLSAMANAGLSGRAALGGMKSILDGLAAPSADAKAAANQLGVTLDGAAIKAQGFGAWLSVVVEKSHGSATALQRLFGSAEGVTAALALAKNQGADMARILGQMQDGSGAAAEAADQMVDQWDRFSTLKNNALIRLGDAIQPLAGKVLGLVNAFLGWFTELPAPVLRVITLVGGFTGVLLVVTGGVMGLAVAFSTMDFALIPVLATLAALAQLFVVLGVAMIPIGAALYGLYAAFDSNLGGIRDTAIAFFDKVKLVWQGLTQLFTDGGFSGSVMTELDKAENAGLKNFVTTLFLWGSRIGAFFDGIQTGFSTALAAAGPVFERLSSAFRALGDAFEKLFGGANDPESSARAFDAFAGSGATVGAVLEKLANIVATVMTRAVTFVTGFIDGLSALKPTFESVWTAAKDIFGIFGDLLGSLGLMTGGIGTTASSFETFGRVLATVVGGVAMVLRGIETLIQIGLTPLRLLVGLMTGGWDGFKDAALASFSAVMAGLIQMAGPVAAVADKIASAFGKDLGAGKALAGLQASLPQVTTATPATAPSTATTLPSRGELTTLSMSSPGVVAAQAAAARVQGGETGAAADRDRRLVEGMGKIVAAIVANGNQPIQVHMDGEKVLDVVRGAGDAKSARAFNPQPNPG